MDYNRTEKKCNELIGWLGCIKKDAQANKCERNHAEAVNRMYNVLIGKR